jgi:hypothetical protein
MPLRCAIGTVKTTTASGFSSSISLMRCRFQRGVTHIRMVSRVSLSRAVSSGLASARRRYRSPFTRASTSRSAWYDSPSR